MGFFSRKDSSSHRRPVGRARPSVSSETQAAQLRVKARRRLAGAVAIVLCAVIVLPMLLDSEPIKVPSNIDVSIPSRNAPYKPDVGASASSAAVVNGSGNQGVVTPASPDAAAASASTPVVNSGTSTVASSVAPPSPTNTLTPSTSSATSAPATKPPEKAPEPVASRTDEAARARAILEGRTLPSQDNRVASSASTSTNGSSSIKDNLVVQIASYSAQADAEARRATLREQGITNAYVEPVTVNGRQVYRLRVGPFSSREAAQAAQARLRTLGYANGFITSQ